MQPGPSFATQFLNHSVRGSYCERNHQYEGCHANGYEWSLSDVADRASEIEEAIEPDIGGEVKYSVEKRNQPQHATKLNKRIYSGDLPERGHS